MQNRVKSDKPAGLIELNQSKADVYMWLKKEYKYSEQEMNDIKMPLVSLLLQRNAEPVYQQRINNMIMKNRGK